jgi:hypothetical protein
VFLLMDGSDFRKDFFGPNVQTISSLPAIWV